MQTLVLIHLTGEDRVLSTMADELPLGTPLSKGSTFQFEQRPYMVASRLDSIDFHAPNGSYEGSIKLWYLLKTLTGSEAGAAAIIDKIEGIGASPYKVNLTRNEEGKVTSISVDGTGVLRCITYVEARAAAQHATLKDLADRLLAQQSTESTATAEPEQPAAS